MPNVFKYTTGAAPESTLKKGNFYIGNNVADYGTTFYTGISPASGGYTIYLNKASGGPSIYVAANDSQLISFTNHIAGTNYTTVNQCFNYFAGQSDEMVVQRDYEGIVTNGLVLNLDAGYLPSYPQNGTSWYDLGPSGNTGTLTNGLTFNSGNGGSIVFDGVDDSTVLPNSSTLSAGIGDFTYNAWIYPLSYSTYAPLFVTATTNGIWIGKNGSNFVLRAYAVTDLLQFGTLPSLNVWTNITITRIGITATLYYNSVSQTTATTSPTATK